MLIAIAIGMSTRVRVSNCDEIECRARGLRVLDRGVDDEGRDEADRPDERERVGRFDVSVGMLADADDADDDDRRGMR